VNRSRKIRLFPNKEQRRVFDRWFGCVRKTYNWTLECIRMDDEIPKTNYIELRKHFVNAEAIPDSMKYLLECPKHIRDGALQDLTAAYKSNFTKRAKDPSHIWEMKFRSRKDSQSIRIPKISQTIDADDKVWGCFAAYLKGTVPFKARKRDAERNKTVRSIDHDCRLLKDRLGRYYLCVPMNSPVRDNQTDGWVALDPGVRTFLTAYSPAFGTAYKIGDGDINRICRLCLHLDGLYSRRAKAVHAKRYKLKRAIVRLTLRIRHLVDDVHWKAIDFLTDNFSNIVVPPFEVSGMVKKGQRKINKKCVRSMITWRHFGFRQRLLSVASAKGVNVHVMGEEYTTKTCTLCFRMNDRVGGAKVFRCPHCNVRVDRDLAGARNIFLKNVLSA